MSVDLNWETLTAGPDGIALAHSIRDFVHAKFQAVQLPRFIKSVAVHDFAFGSIPPELELKDITDPLPEFYEQDSDDSDDDGSSTDGEESDGHEGMATGEMRRDADSSGLRVREYAAAATRLARQDSRALSQIKTNQALGNRNSLHLMDLGSPFLGVSTPGIHGGMSSNLHYLQSHLAAGGLSGAQTPTPLAAVAGAQHRGAFAGAGGGGGGARGFSQLGKSSMINNSSNARTDEYRQEESYFDQHQGSTNIREPSRNRHDSVSSVNHQYRGVKPGWAQSPDGLIGELREKHSVSTLGPASRPPTRDNSAPFPAACSDGSDDGSEGHSSTSTAADGLGRGGRSLPKGDKKKRSREPRMEDIQAVFRIKYAGDVHLLLTADIILDYPMQSFMNIPLRLSITGLSFDGVGVAAHIRKKVHFCFLSPEDALAAVGDEEDVNDSEQPGRPSRQGAEGEQSGVPKPGRMGGLLQEIKVESEIGGREGGKQSLKNVGKVERFVLEQVRRIFEDEFVYPSFWTFLV